MRFHFDDICPILHVTIVQLVFAEAALCMGRRGEEKESSGFWADEASSPGSISFSADLWHENRLLDEGGDFMPEVRVHSMSLLPVFARPRSQQAIFCVYKRALGPLPLCRSIDQGVRPPPTKAACAKK
jgi:hypothetical protein